VLSVACNYNCFDKNCKLINIAAKRLKRKRINGIKTVLIGVKKSKNSATSLRQKDNPAIVMAGLNKL